MPWPPKKILLHAEHVHRAAFALGIAAAAPGQLRHDALGVHAGGEHVAVVAIPGDDLVALLEDDLHADDDRLLADVEVAEAADQPHAVHLAGLLLEAADQQHVAVGVEFGVLAGSGTGAAPPLPCSAGAFGGGAGLFCLFGGVLASASTSSELGPWSAGFVHPNS